MLIDRKLVKVLAIFSTKELNRFQKFVESPYFNVNERILRLVTLIIECIKAGNIRELSDDTVAKNVYAGKSYKNVEIRKLFSDSLKLFQKFLAIEGFQNNKDLLLSIEYQEIQKHQVKELFKSYKSTIRKHKEQTQERSSDFFYYQLLNEKNSFALKSEFEKKNKRIKGDSEFNFLEMDQNLNKFYLYEQLKIIVSIQSWKKLRKLNMDLPNESIVEDLISHGYMKDEPLIQIYYLLYKSYSNPEITDFYFDLRKIVSDNQYVIPVNDIREIYEALVSYAINKVNQGNREFMKESFDVYKEAIESDYYYTHGYLNPSDYRNLIVIGLRIGEISWVKSFIENYKNKIDPNHQTNSYHYALATLAFYQKKFERVIEELQKVNYVDVWYNLNAKSMLLASYFEQGEFEALDNLISSTKVFISREKTLSKDKKVLYQNYLKYINKLSNINSSDVIAIKALEREILETKGVASKAWLLEKLRDFN